jgi:hypothetical protein
MARDLITTKPTALRKSLEIGDAANLTKAIVAQRTSVLESQIIQRAQLEEDIEELRYKWKKASEAPATQMLIEQAANKLKQQLATVQYYPTLRDLATENEDAAKADVAGIVVWGMTKLNVKNNLTRMQVEDLADMMLHSPNYRHLTLEHLAIVVQEGLQGKYGPIYERFDAATVMQWLDKYCSALAQSRMQRNDEYHLSQQESRLNYTNPPTSLRDMIDKFLD